MTTTVQVGTNLLYTTSKPKELVEALKEKDCVRYAYAFGERSIRVVFTNSYNPLHCLKLLETVNRRIGGET